MVDAQLACRGGCPDGAVPLDDELWVACQRCMAAQCVSCAGFPSVAAMLATSERAVEPD